MNLTSGDIFWITLFTAGLTASMILLWHGLAGRLRLAPPRCRACGYDVRECHWPENAAARCPECGAMLAAANAVTCARRQQRHLLTALGLVMLLLAGGGNQMWIMARNIRRPPVVMVPAPAPTPMPAPRAPAKSPHAELEGPRAWEPILKRLEAGEIDSDGANVLLRNATEMLRWPSKNSHTSRSSGMEKFALEVITREMKVDTELLNEALRAICQWNGSVPLTLRADDDDGRTSRSRLKIQIQSDPHGSSIFKQVISLRAIYAKDGAKLRLWHAKSSPVDSPAYDSADLFSANRQSGDIEVWLALPEGKHPLRMVFDVGMVPAGAFPRGMEGSWGIAAKWPQPGKIGEFEHKFTLEVPPVAKDRRP